MAYIFSRYPSLPERHIFFNFNFPSNLIQFHSKSYTSSAATLLKNNYRRDSVKVLRTHAKLLHTFLSDSNSPDTKHYYFLQTLRLLNHAATLTNDIWIEASSLQSTTDLLNISLPVQRELVDIKLEIVQLLTDMLETNLIAVKSRNAKNLQQKNVTKTLESFMAGKN